ncbi:MDGA2 protein, partial [Urocolius indicus]|nr:MDGA2 protein [Urocolius indicus]
MYIETSRPRLEGEKARLVSPVFSVAPKNPYGATNTAYCFSFYYHMYGQHIGERKPMTLFLPLGEIAGEMSACMKEKQGRTADACKGQL